MHELSSDLSPDQAARARALVEHCRARRIPDAVADAAARHLAAGAAAAAFAAAYRAMHAPGAPYTGADEGSVRGQFLLQALSPADRDLDTLDLRLLDLCFAVGEAAVRAYLHAIRSDERVGTACAYACGRHTDESELWRYLPGTPMKVLVLDADGVPDGASKLLLRSLPLRLPEVWRLAEPYARLAFAADLRRLGAPYADMVTTRMLDDLADELAQASYLASQQAVALFELEPDRYEGWLRRLAETPRGHNVRVRVAMLKRLLQHDAATHLDLAVAFARTPVSRAGYDRANIELQSGGLALVRAVDRSQYATLLEEALLGPSDSLLQHAVSLALNEDDARVTRACFRRCVAEMKRRGPLIYRSPGDMNERARAALGGDVSGLRPAALAVRWLLNGDDEPLSGRLAYAVTLLAHRNREVRDLAISWLALRGDAALDGVTPVLRDGTKVGRLCAARVLAAIGGERARTLLRARLTQERDDEVRRVALAALAAADTPARDMAVRQGAKGTEAKGTGATARGDEAARDEAARDGCADRARRIDALVADAVAGQRRRRTPAYAWFDPVAAPAPRWVTGEPVPPVVLEYLLRAQSRMHEAALALPVERALPLIERASAAGFALALARAWAERAPYKDIVGVMLAAALGDDTVLAPVLAKSAPRNAPYEARWRFRDVRLLVLAPLGTDAMLDAVYAYSRWHPGWIAAPHAVYEVFRQVAQRHGVDPEELFDARTGLADVPRSPDGAYLARRDWDWWEGPPAGPLCRVELGLDWVARFLDDAGAERYAFALPRPADGGAHINARLHEPVPGRMRWLIEACVASMLHHARRMEAALATRRTWTTGAWAELFPRHPLWRPIAAGLVWGLLPSPASGSGSGSGGYAALFRPWPDGTARTVDGGLLTLPSAGAVRLVHPAELDAATRGRWAEHLSDAGVIPCIRQLDRPIATPPEEQRSARMLRTLPVPWSFPCPDHDHSEQPWREELEASGWRGEPARPSCDPVETVWKAFHGLGVEAALQRPCKASLTRNEVGAMTLMFVPLGSVAPRTKDRRVLAGDDPRPLPFGSVPAAAYGEVMLDIARLAAGGYYHA